MCVVLQVQVQVQVHLQVLAQGQFARNAGPITLRAEVFIVGSIQIGARMTVHQSIQPCKRLPLRGSISGWRKQRR